MNREELTGILSATRSGFASSAFEISPSVGPMLVRYVQYGPDNDDPFNQDKFQWWAGRWWHIDPDDSVNQVVNTLFKAVLTYQEHELRESFSYIGHRPFKPRH